MSERDGHDMHRLFYLFGEDNNSKKPSNHLKGVQIFPYGQHMNFQDEGTLKGILTLWKLHEHWDRRIRPILISMIKPFLHRLYPEEKQVIQNLIEVR